MRNEPPWMCKVVVGCLHPLRHSDCRRLHISRAFQTCACSGHDSGCCIKLADESMVNDMAVHHGSGSMSARVSMWAMYLFYLLGRANSLPDAHLIDDAKEVLRTVLPARHRVNLSLATCKAIVFIWLLPQALLNSTEWHFDGCRPSHQMHTVSSLFCFYKPNIQYLLTHANAIITRLHFFGRRSRNVGQG